MSEFQDADEKKPAERAEAPIERKDDPPAGRTDETPEKAPPASQAQLDLEASGLTAEDLAAAARVAPEKEAKKQPTVTATAVAAGPRFHWLILLLLATAGGVALAWLGREAPEKFLLWGMAGLSLLLLLVSALPKVRICPRLQTRGGLAAALLAIAIFIQALVGLPAAFFSCPASVVWAGILTLALLWTIVAVVRKLRKFKPLALLVVLVVVYAALGPVMALIGHFSPGEPALTWEALNNSPSFLHLPWFVMPLALTLGLVLPLAAILSLSDQWAALRRPGARHGGNFFLALAWLGLLVSGFLLFLPAMEYCPDLTKKIRGLAPVLAGVESGSAAVSAVSGKFVPDPDPEALTEEIIIVETEEVAGLSAAPVSPPAPAEPSTPPDQEKSPPATAEDFVAKLEELQRQVNDLEGRLRILTDRLNQLEKPGQTLNLIQPLPPGAKAPGATTPDQPLGATPRERGNFGGSAT